MLALPVCARAATASKVKPEYPDPRSSSRAAAQRASSSASPRRRRDGGSALASAAVMGASLVDRAARTVPGWRLSTGPPVFTPLSYPVGIPLGVLENSERLRALAV